jgi:RNA polymerase sigma-70 factor, ECF subfamily
LPAGTTTGDSEFPADASADFAAVVEAHWAAVYRFLYSLSGNCHEAEDLTQETFLRALRRRDSFKPGTKMRSWLLRIAANACFDTRRKQKRVSFRALEYEVASPETRPEHRLETVEQSELLRVALEELSDLTRMVFHLRAVEDLSFREIASLAEISEEAARWHMHHARTRMLKRFSEKRV